MNPGNLRNEDQVREVVKAAKERDIPIRIGVNFGSPASGGRHRQDAGFLAPHGLGEQAPQSR